MKQMMTNQLGRAYDLSYTVQFRLIHDADGLNQTSTEHVGGLVLWKNEQIFEQHAETLSDQFQGIKAGKVHPTLKSGHVARINLHPVCKLLLRQSRLLAQLLNPPPDSLFGVHALVFRVDRAISHSDAAVNRVRKMHKSLKTRRKTFHLLKAADTIAVRHSLLNDKGLQKVVELIFHTAWMSSPNVLNYGEER